VKTLRPLLIALLIAFAAPVAAEQPAPPAESPMHLMDGEIAQGGLMRGTVPVGTKLRCNGTEIPVSSSGAFVIALARDATPWLTVTAYYPDGQVEQKKLTVVARKWDVQSINGLPQRQVTPNANDMIGIRDEQKKIADARARMRDDDDFMNNFVWPVTGIITGVYGSQRILNGTPMAPHLGIDIAAPEGTPIVAPADGVVTLAGRNLYLNGNLVIIDHGLGVNSVYAHLAQIKVIDGQPVRQGDVIGTLGHSGRATGPNLHFGLNVRGVGVDPAPVLGPQPGANNTTVDVDLKHCKI
jgi:murein DD-endopeptidase MepM/ murein hydrolase activator NlpD